MSFKKQMILPDDLIERVKVEAEAQHMNFTQYTIRALSQMVEADTLLRTQPEINKKMLELREMLSKVSVEQ